MCLIGIWHSITLFLSDRRHSHSNCMFWPTVLRQRLVVDRPLGLTFTWRGCYSLCFTRKLTELAHSVLFCSCVCFCLYGRFNYISFHTFSRRLSAFSLCSSGVISAVLVLSTIQLIYISLWKSPSAPPLPPQWGATDAEIKVISSENTELKIMFSL